MIPSETIEKLTFKNIIMSIGVLPSSYVDSMSYYETLVWLCNYLENIVIPAVNNNGEAVEELQGLFVDLKTYIDTAIEEYETSIDNQVESLETYMNNYFNNLDIQTEINNKINAMVTNGTFGEIVNSYLTTYLTELLSINENLGYIHISIDDVTSSLSRLKNNSSYTSIFDDPLFAYLKTLHDTYQAKFSLYVFSDVFNTLNNKYANDFTANLDWLKIGFHAVDSGSNLSTSTYGAAKTSYEAFTQEAKFILGNSNAIDRIPRLANFAGTVSACCGLRDSNMGCLGFLTADDDRLSYYFTNQENNYINKYYNYYDQEKGLYFVKTLKRLEQMTNITDELNTYKNSASKSDCMLNFEIFTHESDVISSGVVANNNLEIVCQWANTNNIKFDYAQNKIQNNRSIVANPKHYVDFYGTLTPVKQDPNKLTFIKGTLTDWIPTPSTNVGRAVTTDVLQVPYGSTLVFDNQLGYSISYALVEYGSDPINDIMLDGGEQYARWLTSESLTLSPDTKFMTIVVKKTDNSTTDFTDAELISIANSFSLE